MNTSDLVQRPGQHRASNHTQRLIRVPRKKKYKFVPSLLYPFSVTGPLAFGHKLALAYP